MMRPLMSLLLLLVVIAGCIDRARVNTRCEWTADTRLPLDLLNPADRRHLVNDSQLAEELAIRYADSEHKRLFGLEAHGGLLDQGRVRNACMARLVAAIAADHAVTADQIRSAREQRDPEFDLAAALSFLPFYCVAAAMVCRGLRRRFSADRRSARWAITGLTSVAVSFLGLQLGQLWLSVWEMARVGNDHISSFRAAAFTHWSFQHAGALSAGGILLFWLIALRCYRTMPPDDRIPADLHAPQGIVLR